MSAIETGEIGGQPVDYTDSEERYEVARSLKLELGKALEGNPGFQRAVAETVVRPNAHSRNIVGDSGYEVSWQDPDGTRFRAMDTSGRSILTVHVYADGIADSATVIVNRTMGTGDFEYRKTHLSSAPMDRAGNSARAVDQIKTHVLARLQSKPQ